MRELAGIALYRPWFDSLATTALADWYFPLSRAWAAGLAAHGSMDRFLAALPRERSSPWLGRTLERLERDQIRYQTVDGRWRRAFFSDAADSRPGRLGQFEHARRRAALRLMAGRYYFLSERLLQDIPPMQWQITSPDEVRALHGERLSNEGTAYALPDTAPPIEQSRRMVVDGQASYWLRFPTPLERPGDTVWARVDEPAAGGDVPTLVFLHGIGVEFEFWPEARNIVGELVAAGVRVIRPEGPWHGRRRANGFFGGEPVLAKSPLGVLDYLHAAVVEAGILIGWARQHNSSPIAIGGISLGSLTSQVAAGACRYWPDTARPDFLLLIAAGGNFLRLTTDSSLTRRLGLPDQLQKAGWTTDELAQWRPLAEPMSGPALEPDRIVVTLGSADMVTPYDDAAEMVRRWGVPDDNVFTARKGHFSVSLDTAWLARPLSRLHTLFRELGPRA
jgi:hypothetical protein